MASAVFNDLFESLKLIQDATLADELDFEAISNSSNYWFEKGDDSICRQLTCDSYPDEDAIKSLLASNHRLRSLSSLLENLTKSVQSTYNALSTTARDIFYKYGINALPNETLEYVMELACDPASTEHLSLSHVSRRFRQVARGHHKLWSHISGSKSLQWVNLQLTNSGNHKLSIDFNAFNCTTNKDIITFATCECAYILPPLVQHCRRWYSFKWTHDALSLVDPPSDAPKTVIRVMDSLRNLHLPSLRHLSVFHNASDRYNDGVSASICNTWIMPNLRSLRSGKGINKLQLCSRITSAVLHTGTNVDSQTAAGFYYFLASAAMSDVEELLLNIGEPTPYDNEEKDPIRRTSPSMINLCHLKSIHFKVGGSHESRSFFTRLLQILLTPSLKHLEFTIYSRHNIVPVWENLLRWFTTGEAGDEPLESAIFTFHDPWFYLSLISSIVETLEQFMRVSRFMRFEVQQRPRIDVRFNTGASQGTSYIYDWSKEALP